MTRPDCPDARYSSLWSILMDAFEQATEGKGEERHGSQEPYEQQPTALILRQMGTGFADGQAVKKLLEAQRLPPDRARSERLGAIVYTAFAQIEADRAAASTAEERLLEDFRAAARKALRGVCTCAAFDIKLCPTHGMRQP